MKIVSIRLHNFRSIKDIEFKLIDYNMLTGANNAGKTNIITALRIFYEDGIKFNEKLDFPKFGTDDEESWIEIKYKPTDDEFKTLREVYKDYDKTFKVRKYLKSKDKNRAKVNQSNIYAYENGKLSTNLFYGAKNISQSKLGSVIYIPEVTKTNDALKLTGPSPLRNTLTFVMKKVVKTSESFKSLNEAFDKFNTKFKEEASKDGVSLEDFRKKINKNLKEWGVEFNIYVNPVRPEDIIKNLVSHSFTDKTLDKEMNIELYGQGLQRHLVYTLIRLSSQYREAKSYEKKEFSPELTLILFEEPEAFLHPTQQEILNLSLRDLSSEDGQQIIISTHSPTFVSKNIEEISSIIKLSKKRGITNCFQVSEETKKSLVKQNNKLARLLKDRLEGSNISEKTRDSIRNILGKTDDERRMNEEAMRYSLWLDAERSSLFFADTVLICEGATEKVFIDYLIKNEWKELMEKKIYVLDAMGKFNIHRYMNLFKELGIYHSVLADRDVDRNVHKIINQFIEANKNDYTKGIYFFDNNIEDFLCIPTPPSNRGDKKPLNVMWHYMNDKISKDKITKLKKIIKGII